MKKINYTWSVLAVGLVLLSSCNKFLSEHPKSQQPVDAYYQTIDQVQSAVTYLYNVASGPNYFYNPAGVYDGTNGMTLDNLSGMSNNVVAQNPAVRPYSSL